MTDFIPEHYRKCSVILQLAQSLQGFKSRDLGMIRESTVNKLPTCVLPWRLGRAVRYSDIFSRLQTLRRSALDAVDTTMPTTFPKFFWPAGFGELLSTGGRNSQCRRRGKETSLFLSACCLSQQNHMKTSSAAVAHCPTSSCVFPPLASFAISKNSFSCPSKEPVASKFLGKKAWRKAEGLLSLGGENQRDLEIQNQLCLNIFRWSTPVSGSNVLPITPLTFTHRAVWRFLNFIVIL